VIWTLGGSGRCAQRVAEFSLKTIAIIRKWPRVQVSNPTGAIGWPSLWINYLPMRMVPPRAEMTSIEKMRRSGANSEIRHHQKHATCRCYHSIEKHKKSANAIVNRQKNHLWNWRKSWIQAIFPTVFDSIINSHVLKWYHWLVHPTLVDNQVWISFSVSYLIEHGWLLLLMTTEKLSQFQNVSFILVAVFNGIWILLVPRLLLHSGSKAPSKCV
jgi:hypothetical protein